MHSFWKYIQRSFLTIGQKTFLVLIFLSALVISLYTVRDLYLVEVPKAGGSYTEMLVGAPRYINPLLAVSQTDRDLSSLIYAPLMRATGETQEMILATNLEQSQDGTEYIVSLRRDAFFHDGMPLTAQDVVFTIETLKDPLVNSPLLPQWLGITVEATDDYTLLFTLEKAYPQFPNLLDIGVMPQHIWETIRKEDIPFSTNNIQPIGSGPYVIQDVKRNDREAIEAYTLTASRNSIFNPYIDTLIFSIATESQELIDALNNKHIDGGVAVPISALQEDVLDNVTIRTYTLPRVFTLFYNQGTDSLLKEQALREAIDTVIDKQALIREVLGGYGQALDGPLPATSPYAVFETDDQTQEDRIEQAVEILEDAGWELSTESSLFEKNGTQATLTLTTPESEELVRIANRIRSQLANIGIAVTVSFLPQDDLIQNVIRPRDYELLLFGYVTDIPANIYPFWHSSGRSDPGLNIAEYGSIVVDRELATIQTSQEDEELRESYETIRKELSEDVPATFLFSQDLLYVQDDRLRHNVSLASLEYPEDRFNTVEQWYVKTERLLPFLVK